MGQLHLIADDLKAERLVPLYDLPLKRAYGYYVLHAKNVKLHPAAKSFITWINSVAQG